MKKQWNGNNMSPDNEQLPPIVWVETGRKIPRYGLNNAKLLRLLHPMLKQFRVTDSEDKQEGIQVFKINEKSKSDLTRRFEAIQKSFIFKQEYFWLGTTSRFFYLYDFMIDSGLSKVIHMESDCILLSLDGVRKLSKLEENFVAFPLQTLNEGCASIFYVNSQEALREFLEFTLDYWHVPSETDMTILGRFSRNGKAKILDTWPEKNQENKLIYDAGSLGPYYLGSDARNFRIPFSRRGRLDLRPGSIGFRIREAHFCWTVKREEERISVELEIENEIYHLQNLHVHSKQIAKSVNKLHRQLKYSFNRTISPCWELGNLDMIVVLERCVSFAQRRVNKALTHKSVNLR